MLPNMADLRRLASREISVAAHRTIALNPQPNPALDVLIAYLLRMNCGTAYPRPNVMCSLLPKKL